MSLLRAWCTLTVISFRRLLWSANTAMVLLPLGGCLLFILRRHHRHPEFTERGFRDFSEFMILIFASFVVPICALAFGTASIGGDREDRTLVFLLVRPIPRPLVLLAKFAATLPLVFGLVIGSYWLYCQLAGEVGQKAFPLYLPALVGMTAAYVCLFHLFAVAFRHSTIIALIYALFMELLLGNLPGIIKRVAVNYYGRSIMYDAGANEGLPRPDARWFELLAPETAAWALAGIAVSGLALAILIFSRREYRDLT
jgi:ABC-2 type transport system permease protein